MFQNNAALLRMMLYVREEAICQGHFSAAAQIERAALDVWNAVSTRLSERDHKDLGAEVRRMIEKKCQAKDRRV